MFSNLESEPIEHGGELNKAKEGGGEFIVTRSDAAVALDPSEEVFDAVALAVVATVKEVAPVAPTFGSDASADARLVESAMDGVCIEAAVSDDVSIYQSWQQWLDRPHVMTLSCRQAEADCSAAAVGNSGQLGIDAAFGQPHRLVVSSSGWIGAVLMQLDV